MRKKTKSILEVSGMIAGIAAPTLGFVRFLTPLIAQVSDSDLRFMEFSFAIGGFFLFIWFTLRWYRLKDQKAEMMEKEVMEKNKNDNVIIQFNQRVERVYETIDRSIMPDEENKKMLRLGTEISNFKTLFLSPRRSPIEGGGRSDYE